MRKWAKVSVLISSLGKIRSGQSRRVCLYMSITYSEKWMKEVFNADRAVGSAVPHTTKVWGSNLGPGLVCVEFAGSPGGGLGFLWLSLVSPTHMCVCPVVVWGPTQSLPRTHWPQDRFQVPATLVRTSSYRKWVRLIMPNAWVLNIIFFIDLTNAKSLVWKRSLDENSVMQL